jgi:hypothetical protein
MRGVPLCPSSPLTAIDAHAGYIQSWIGLLKADQTAPSSRM